MSALKQFYRGWMRVVHVIGNVQARVILTVLYLIMVVPVGFVMRLFSDPLRLRPTEGTYWVERAAVEPGLASAGREY